MTYNFDPDRWRENEQMHLERLLKDGKLTEEAFERKSAELDLRCQEMWLRLDNSCRIPFPSAVEKSDDS